MSDPEIGTPDCDDEQLAPRPSSRPQAELLLRRCLERCLKRHRANTGHHVCLRAIFHHGECDCLGNHEGRRPNAQRRGTRKKQPSVKPSEENTDTCVNCGSNEKQGWCYHVDGEDCVFQNDGENQSTGIFTADGVPIRNPENFAAGIERMATTGQLSMLMERRSTIPSHI